MRHFLSKKKLVWGGILVAGVIITAFVCLYAWGKSYGNLSRLPTENKPLPESVSKAVTRYMGQYITFLYPITFKAHPPEKIVKKPLLESFFASQSDSQAGQSLAVLVQENETGFLSDSSAYIYRKTHPELYFEEKIDQNGTPVTLFTKKSPVYEVGAFWTAKKRSVSVVFSSAVGLSELRERLLEILATFEWKK